MTARQGAIGRKKKKGRKGSNRAPPAGIPVPRAKTVKKVKLVGPKKAKRASQYRFLRDNARSMPSPDEIANMPEEMRVWQASKLTTRLVNGVTRVYGVSHTQLKRQIGEWATMCSQLNDEHPDPGIDSQWDKMCQLRHRLDKRSISETDLHHVMLAVGMAGMTSCQKKVATCPRRRH